MDAAIAFRGLEPYKLSGVTISEQGNWYGAATDMEIDYRGLRCAGKMAIELLLMEEEMIKNFQNNCHQLSKLRHPNVAQFLGIFIQEGLSAPILVMEFLPINLSFCIDQYGRLPKVIGYSILHDIALGLCFIHGQAPAIFHGNLSSNAILLDSNMTAKISEFGTLSLTPLQITHVTQTTENTVFVAPEALANDPRYDTSMDMYSYGVTMIHVLSGRWPAPLTESNDLIKRETVRNSIGRDHPMIELILKCTNLDSQQRASASEIEQEVLKMVTAHPPSFANRLDMLKQLEEDKKSQSAAGADELKKEVEETEKQIQAQTQDIEKLKAENDQLRAKLAKNGELIGSTIQLLQFAQQKRQSNLQMETKTESPSGIQTSADSTDGQSETMKRNSRHNSSASSIQSDDIAQKIRKRSSTSGSGKGGVYSPPPIYEAKYDFEALSEKDMSFKMGTKMFIIDKSEGNWWYGRNMDTLEEGYAPTNYIADVETSKNATKDIQLVKKIETGTCFEVWEGLWNRSVPIAVKKKMPKAKLSYKFTKELEAMQTLHHPNLVSFYISCTNDGILCLILEYMKHGTLLDYLRQNRQSLTLQQQITSAAQVATGMAYLEEKDFPHQSLAARNVMMTKAGVCKVTDYGIQRLIDGRKGVGPEHSPRWTAPEAYEQGMFSMRSDVWSYGTLLYEIITFGKFPYPGLSNDQVLKTIKEGSRIPCPRGCQQKTYDIMMSCWSISPDNRPTFATLKKLTTNYFNAEEEEVEQDEYVEVHR